MVYRGLVKFVGSFKLKVPLPTIPRYSGTSTSPRYSGTSTGLPAGIYRQQPLSLTLECSSDSFSYCNPQLRADFMAASLTSAVGVHPPWWCETVGRMGIGSTSGRRG
jgi:hypothetical protein